MVRFVPSTRATTTFTFGVASVSAATPRLERCGRRRDSGVILMGNTYSLCAVPAPSWRQVVPLFHIR